MRRGGGALLWNQPTATAAASTAPLSIHLKISKRKHGVRQVILPRAFAQGQGRACQVHQVHRVQPGPPGRRSPRPPRMAVASFHLPS